MRELNVTWFTRTSAYPAPTTLHRGTLLKILPAYTVAGGPGMEGAWDGQNDRAVILEERPDGNSLTVVDLQDLTVWA